MDARDAHALQLGRQARQARGRKVRVALRERLGHRRQVAAEPGHTQLGARVGDAGLERAEPSVHAAVACLSQRRRGPGERLHERLVELLDRAPRLAAGRRDAGPRQNIGQASGPRHGSFAPASLRAFGEGAGLARERATVRCRAGHFRFGDDARVVAGLARNTCSGGRRHGCRPGHFRLGNDRNRRSRGWGRRRPHSCHLGFGDNPAHEIRSLVDGRFGTGAAGGVIGCIWPGDMSCINRSWTSGG